MALAEPKRCVAIARLLLVGMAAGMLAACNHATIATDREASLAPTRQPPAQEAPITPKKPRVARSREKARTTDASDGLASYYRHGSRTASGERFNAGDMTAAHPTLPFGTRVRVTNLATGRSVMVRVNDRGPFVKGRVIDVSYAAAQSLGMVDRGIAKVKVDVVP